LRTKSQWFGVPVMGRLVKSLAIFISMLCSTVPVICDVNGEHIGELVAELDNQTLVVDKLNIACGEMESQLGELVDEATAEKAAELTRRIDFVKSSLEALDSRLSSLGDSDLAERAAEMRNRVDTLLGESDRLKERVESCREEIILRSNSPGENGNGLSGMIDEGSDRLAYLVVSLSEKLKSSFSTISSTLGSILGGMARIEAGTVEAGGSNPMAVVVLTLGLAAALGGTSYVIQNYWSGGFSAEGMLLMMRSKLGLGSPEIYEETSSTLSQPFWDPVPKIEGNQGRVSAVDQEYIRTLLKLGYIEEARAVMKSLEGTQQPHGTLYVSRQIPGHVTPRISLKKAQNAPFRQVLRPVFGLATSLVDRLGDGVISLTHLIFDALRRREG